MVGASDKGASSSRKGAAAFESAAKKNSILDEKNSSAHQGTGDAELLKVRETLINLAIPSQAVAQSGCFVWVLHRAKSDEK